MSQSRLRLYSDFAQWWPLFSPPVHYVEEAADLLPSILRATAPPPRTLLELGSGGGSLAWHFKDHLQLTLTDVSSDMLEVSRTVNPECEHVQGDMRTLDLGREFDVVFVHDAIMYMTDEASLRAAMATAYRHCRAGGAAFFVPDCVTETFEPATEQGGEDGADGRGMRYVQWTWRTHTADNSYHVAFALVLREPNGQVRFDGELQEFGVFPRASWLDWLAAAGFAATSRTDPWKRDVFLARKPA